MLEKKEWAVYLFLDSFVTKQSKLPLSICDVETKESAEIEMELPRGI